LIEQFEIVLDVVISVLDFIVRGIIVWLVRYIVNWLRQLPSEFLMTLKVVLGEVVKFIRSALLQLPLHALAAYCVWGIAVFFRGYVYDESNTVYVFLAASALNIAGIAFCFLVGVPLTLGRYVRSDYVPILRELAENLADVIPHALFVFVGACWSLIGLTHFFGVGNFSRGPLTGLSSGILLFAILVVWLRRQVNKRVST
jgi:hypothetical protein